VRGDGLEIGLGLIVLMLALIGGGGEVGAFQFGYQLAGAHVVAAVDEMRLTGAVILEVMLDWSMG